MVFPKSNLPGGAVPWGREVQKRIEATDSKLASLAINDRSDTKQLQDSYRRLDQTVQGLQEADIEIAAATAAAAQAAQEAQDAIDGLISLGTSSSLYDINADNINAGTLTGVTVQTGSSGTRIKMQGTDLEMYYLDNLVGTLSGYDQATAGQAASLRSGSGDSGLYVSDDYAMMINEFGTPRGVQVSLTNARIFAGSNYVSTNSTETSVGGPLSVNGGITTNTVSASSSITGSSLTVNNNVFAPGIPSTTSAANMRWSTSGNGQFFYSTSSSAKYKDNIVDISTVESLDPYRLLALPVRGFTYKSDYPVSEADSRYQQMIPGFIAEEVAEHYPMGADYEGDQVESWNERMIVPGMLALIQDLHKEVQQLKTQVAELQSKVQ